MVLQFSVMGALCYFGGWGAMLRIQIVPYFLVFPVAFTLNRLGQHYNIDPTHPLKWATLMKPSRLWDFLFVYSNYHLEHHYFPRVPVLQPPQGAHAPAAALRPARPQAAHVPRDRVAVVRAEPGAAHGLGARGRRPPGPPSPATRDDRGAVPAPRVSGQVAARVATH